MSDAAHGWQPEKPWGGNHPERNWEITVRVIAGETYRGVAPDYDITQERVRQIALRTCRTTYPDIYSKARNGQDGHFHERPRLRDLRLRLFYLFTEERPMSEDALPYTPVVGYRELTREELDDMNTAKHTEAEVLLLLYRIHGVAHYDSRWSAIAKTHIEQGFMALNRAIARPNPVKLPVGDGGVVPA